MPQKLAGYLKPKIMAGMDAPTAGNSTKLRQEATICGKQMLPLNSPRYPPIFSPDRALVTMVIGVLSLGKIPVKESTVSSRSIQIITFLFLVNVIYSFNAKIPFVLSAKKAAHLHL
jgi:hypothetical protein